MSRTKVRIFENEPVEELAILFKRNRSMETFAKICELTHNLLQAIVISEKYLDRDDVYNHLYLQIERWIDRWVPGKGHLYAYISASAKNAAVSYVTKESQHRSNIIGTDVPLESFVDADGGSGGFSEIAIPSGEMERIREELRALEVRWHEPEIRAALRYCFHAIFEGRCLSVPDRTCVMRYLQCVEVTRHDGSTYQLTVKQAKALMAYAQGAVRLMFLNNRVSSFTEVDLLKVRCEFSQFNDIEALVGTDGARRILEFFAGSTLKFPSKKVHTDAKVAASKFNTAVMDRFVERVSVRNGEWEFDDNDPDSADIRSGALAVASEIAEKGYQNYPVFDEEAIDQFDSLFRGHGEGE